MINSLTVLLSVVIFTVLLSFNHTPKITCDLELKVSYWTERLKVEKLTPLKEDKRIIFLSYFNNEPPMTDSNPKYVMVYVHTQLNRAIVLFKEDGPCINSVHMIPAKIVTRWLTTNGI